MALVTKITKQDLEKDAKHIDVECTYSIIDSDNGKFLQIDTYGSSNRQIKGKKSQSIRLNENAVKQLKLIIKDFEFKQ